MLYREFWSIKMQRNIEKYINFDEDEKIDVILDLTIFSEGLRGLICTNKRFIKFNRKKCIEFSLKKLKAIEAREVDPERYEYRLILTDTEGSEHDLTETSIPNDELKVFAYIIQKVHNLKPAGN